MNNVNLILGAPQSQHAERVRPADDLNDGALSHPRQFSKLGKPRSRTFAICIDNPVLLARIRRIATTLFVSLRELDPENVVAAIIQEPSLTVLLGLEDSRFLEVARLCNERALAPQDSLIRLVDGADYGACVETASICVAVNTPKSDLRFRELLAKFCELSFADHAFISKSELPAADAKGEQYIVDTDHEVYALARKIAATDVDIVLLGETGTGKDWLARYIHRQSGSQGPFMAINCAAIPEALAEAELFGVEVGAFTGATKSRAGRIEAAHNGVLYLDEIDSMPLTLQAKLLRALQDRGVERVGSTMFRACNFRVIVSTKVSLAKLVEQGKFRADLHYRLSVVELQLPVLRSQPARLLSLFWRCAAEAARRFNTRLAARSRAALEAQILAHRWDGNIRELRAAAQRFALGFQPLPDTGDALDRRSLKEVLLQYERSLLESTMLRCDSNVARASKELRIEPHVLYYKLKILGIQSGAATEKDGTSLVVKESDGGARKTKIMASVRPADSDRCEQFAPG